MTAGDARSLVLDAIKNASSENGTELGRYFATDYVDHAPEIASGSKTLDDLLRKLKGGGVKSETVRILADGNLVAMHGRYTVWGDRPVVGFDIFRVSDGKLAEHWDNTVPEAPPNPSGHTQIDGSTEIADLDRTADNRSLVTDFITRALIQGEHVDFTSYVDPNGYVQHNSMVGDGLAAFRAFLSRLASQGVTMRYSRIHLVVAEGNFVLTASEGTLAGKPQAFYDLFRVSGGRIVEHWDTISDMPPAARSGGSAGKF